MPITRESALRIGLLARDTAALVAGDLADAAERKRFVLRIASYLEVDLTAPPAGVAVGLMNDAQLAATPMPFGQHEGTPLSAVPRDYLEWLCGANEDFYDVLKEYLRRTRKR